MAYKPVNGNFYDGKQVIIDSDRLLFNAKNDSILLYSRRSIGLSTQGSIHFDTSDQKEDNEGVDASKFVVNSPNIYLGLKFDKNLPTEPAVLGDELDEWLTELMNTIDHIYDDILYNISYMAPTGLTVGNSLNERPAKFTRQRIKNLKKDIQYIKSKTTKIA